MHKSTTSAEHSRRRLGHLLALVLLACAAGGCASGDQTLDAVDPNAVATAPTYEQVFAIIHNNCVSCHDDGDEGEEDFLANAAAMAAEDQPGLEDCTSIVALRFDILDQVNANAMPPGAMPRLTSEEKLIIRRWVENGAVAPCNPSN